MNRNDFKKLLAELNGDLKISIDKVKNELINVKSLYTRIKSYVDNSQLLIDKINNKETGLEKILINSQSLESQISELKNGAESGLNSITTSLSQIQPHIVEMEELYTKFTEINNKITDKETGLEKILINSQSLESQISELKNGAEIHLQSINDDLNNIKVHIVEMEELYTKFTEINNKITDKETGLEKILSDSELIKSDIEAVKKTSETVFKEISRLKDLASGYVADLKKSADTAKKTIEMITKNHEESEELKEKINTIFNISSESAHANYFNDRQKMLLIISLFWFALSIIAVISLIYLGERYIFPLVQSIETGDKELFKTVTIETLFIRLGLITPSIFTLFYCLKQYGSERRLYEKYAFKAISMLTIESSVSLLNRSLSNVTDIAERDSKVTTFALDVLESTYKDPIETNRQSLLFKVGNKLVEFSAELKESMGVIKNKISKLQKIKTK